MSQFAMDDNERIRLQENAPRLSVRFFYHPVERPDLSEKEGRPIFVEEEFVEIQVPGDKDNKVMRGVRQIDRDLYPTQYAAFKAKQEQPLNGTPLEQIPFLTRSQVMEFNALGLRTAEQVRDMSDSLAQKFMGIHSIRKRVTDFLALAAGAAPLEKLHAALRDKDEQIDALQKALKEQGDKIDQLMKKK